MWPGGTSELWLAWWAAPGTGQGAEHGAHSPCPAQGARSCWATAHPGATVPRASSAWLRLAPVMALQGLHPSHPLPCPPPPQPGAPGAASTHAAGWQVRGGRRLQMMLG